MNVDFEIGQFARQDFSQFGEAGVLNWLFHGRRDGFYVDVGCHHPFRLSNTAFLHIYAGWTGINIDLDKRAIALFAHYRPGDVNLNIGIAAEAGQRQAIIFDEGAINTFDSTVAAHPAWEHIPRHIETVEVRPLRAVLDEYLPTGQSITLLTIDAEGFDQEVLGSNDWARFRPEAIAVEASDLDLSNVAAHPTHRLLASLGYHLISYCALTAIYRIT